MKINYFLLIIFFTYNIIIKSERIHTSDCEIVENVQSFKDCLGKKPTNVEDYYCCYSYFSYLGNKAKYCFEFAKKDIDQNKIKDTIDKIEKGTYWEGEIQTYDVHNLQCDKGSFINVNFFYVILFIYLFFIL